MKQRKLLIATIIYLIGLIIGLISCKKDPINEIEKEYQTEVTFIYNGQNVTYKVIKKSYFIDFNGNTLQNPIIKLWLDRNLGAERQAIVENDSLAAGDLFQWGRKADGHQRRESDTIHSLSESITPNHDKFIVKPLNAKDWLIESNDSLWNDKQNTNCPCPDGWRVPTIEELEMEMHSWVSYNMDGAYSSSLKWVSGGNRSNHGTELYSEYWAFVWSSTALEYGMANKLAIIGSVTTEVISSLRIYGGSVRCIKDY